MSDDIYIPPPYAERIRRASTLRRLTLAGLAFGVALAAAIVLAVVILQTETDQLPRLFGVLAVAGLGSLIAGGILLWLLGNQRGRRLSARMITAHVIGLLVVVATVGVSATFLFDSTHDFEQLGLILAFAVAVAAIYSSFISGWFTSPLNELAGASRLLAEGDVTIRLPDAGEKELADLGLAMNTMAGRLQFAYQRQRTLEESQRYLVAAVISELQEPLSSLDRGSAMLIASQEPDAALVRRIAAGMQRDLARQQELLDGLAEMAAIDGGQVTVNWQPVVLSAHVLAACERLTPRASMIGVRLLPRVDFALSPVMADPEHLGTVLDHLIEQAMRQGESGDAVLIEILDTGFEAQVNISSSRSPYTMRHDSYSINHVIARKLIELQHGRVWTAQPLTGGPVTSFTLTRVVDPV